jgi:hypothetical protein
VLQEPGDLFAGKQSGGVLEFVDGCDHASCGQAFDPEASSQRERVAFIICHRDRFFSRDVQVSMFRERVSDPMVDPPGI